jgi:hypothetical protein
LKIAGITTIVLFSLGIPLLKSSLGRKLVGITWQNILLMIFTAIPCINNSEAKTTMIESSKGTSNNAFWKREIKNINGMIVNIPIVAK